MFKSGDRVICVDAGSNRHIKNGKVYTIEIVETDGYISKFHEVDGGAFPRRFILEKEEENE